jgi:eukaryotic-like serine/threonine-protein kinase
MTLAAGTRLGPYEILAPLGAGGMGEVYRARDAKLNRDVAIKVLPSHLAEDPEALSRFEREAKAVAALSHPNILAIFDFQQVDGVRCAVMELLDGETLRSRVAMGALPARKVVEYGAQIAQGLAAAHERGIVHRDLKPENVFVTADGRVKILDFGLAKQTPAGLAGQDTRSPTMTKHTEPGTVMGTVGYMSPEQVRGRPADHLSDIFSLGAVLYEMTTGRRAFQKDTGAETMTAILKEEPPDISESGVKVPPGLERIVAHCLEKSPQERFQSARDIAFDLQSLSSATTPTTRARALPDRRSQWQLAAGLAALAAYSALLLWLGHRGIAGVQPTFRQLTFRRGRVTASRFAPDGQSVIYSAAWGGAPSELFSVRLDTPESTSLGVKDAVLAATRTGEIAVMETVEGRPPTLAVAPIAGGPPRAVMDDVMNADWVADGTKFMIHRWTQGKEQIEFPAGKILHHFTSSVANPRLSPRADRIAFVEIPVVGDTRGYVAVVDLAGNSRRLSGPWLDIGGLAWSGDGKEVWFTATNIGLKRSLWAVSLDGKLRPLLSVPGRLILDDVYRDGRVLLTQDTYRGELRGQAPGETREHDYSWLDMSDPASLSADGKTLVFTEWGNGGGERYSIFLRRTDGSPPVRLGEGWALGLSPDGKWVLAMTVETPPKLVLIPTGTGARRELPRGSIDQYHGAGWFPDGKRIAMRANERDRPIQVFVQFIDDGAPRAISPQTIEGTVVSPDGRWIVASPSEPGRPSALYPVEGGEPRPIPGFASNFEPVGWSADGKELFVQEFNLTGIQGTTVWRLNVETGQKQMWRQLGTDDPVGIIRVTNVKITPDGSAYFYRIQRVFSDLYMVEGLK